MTRLLSLFVRDNPYVAITILLVTLAGVGLFYFGEVASAWSPPMSAAIRSLATVIVTIILVQLVTRIYLWKYLETQMLRRMGLPAELGTFGVEKICWYEEIPWKELFDGANDVEIVALTGHSIFLTDRSAFVRSFLRKKSSRLTLLLQDLSDPDLDPGYDKTKSDRVERISKVLEAVQELAGQSAAAKRVTIELCSAIYKYSIFRFDSTVIYTPHPVSQARYAPERLPAIWMTLEGGLAKSLIDCDVKEMRKHARSVPIEEKITS